MLNAVPAFVYTARKQSKYIVDENYYKTEFNVDKNLPSPNIYWLLMDGMLGFKAMEYLFNDPQPEFTAQLTERGFKINRDAQFEALHSTNYCIPALMCPTYYDSYFIPKLKLYFFDKKEKLLHSKKVAMLARIKNELILAFNRKGYQTSSIVIYPDLYYFSPDVLYINNKKITQVQELNNKINRDQEGIQELYSIFSLFTQNTPLGWIVSVFDMFMNHYLKKYYLLNIQEISSQPFDNIELFFGESYHENDRWYLSALADIMNQRYKLVIIHDMKAHFPFIYSKEGKRIKTNFADPYSYLPQHHFASSIVISYIDFITNKDPDAIIVIQSDHGLHYNETRQILISKYGKTDEDVRLMQNQTISAVRIPEKWGGLEQPIEPPNITRLLVNRYVGENYKMLAPEDIIK